MRDKQHTILSFSKDVSQMIGAYGAQFGTHILNRPSFFTSRSYVIGSYVRRHLYDGRAEWRRASN